MKEKILHDTPVLFFNSGKEDKEAYNALMASGIPCEYIGSTSVERSPLLFWRYREYAGEKEIKRFIERWRGQSK